MRTAAANLTVSDIMRRSRQAAARRRLIKKRIGLITLIGLLVIAFSVILFGNVIVKAQEEHVEDNMVKGYTSIKISSADTLWSIAEANMDEHYESVYEYIQEVKDLNGLTSDTIHSGSLLIIPVYIAGDYCGSY